MALGYSIELAVQLYEYYAWTLTFADKRVENWTLMTSPVYTALLVAAYLLFLLVGRKAMSRLPPFELRFILIGYNLFLTALNAYMFVELLYVSYRLGYSYICQPVSYDPNNRLESRIASCLWWFYFSKLLEFADSVFFVLRKKNNQLTFLHVYHHTTMFCFWWIGVKWVAGGSAWMGAMLNSFVHVFMYAYYFLASAFPGRNIWWKKHLTALQLVQFFIAIASACVVIYVDCPFPRWMSWTLIGYMISFIVLFSNFWVHAYGAFGGKRNKSCKSVGISPTAIPYCRPSLSGFKRRRLSPAEKTSSDFAAPPPSSDEMNGFAPAAIDPLFGRRRRPIGGVVGDH